MIELSSGSTCIKVIDVADMEARVGMTWLMDFYAPLLTEHQHEVARLYCEEDLSLAEIAQQLCITRQGASDALNKARKLLEEYESKLGLAARYREMSAQARKALDALNAGSDARHIQAAKSSLQQLLRGEAHGI